MNQPLGFGKNFKFWYYTEGDDFTRIYNLLIVIFGLKIRFEYIWELMTLEEYNKMAKVEA